MVFTLAFFHYSNANLPSPPKMDISRFVHISSLSSRLSTVVFKQFLPSTLYGKDTIQFENLKDIKEYT